jgi:hypothetical protein
VTAVSDTCAWTAYTDTYNGSEYYNYDYVVESDGGFWYTEFYCLSKNAGKYAPLFETWAQTIEIDNEMAGQELSRTSLSDYAAPERAEFSCINLVL